MLTAIIFPLLLYGSETWSLSLRKIAYIRVESAEENMWSMMRNVAKASRKINREELNES